MEIVTPSLDRVGTAKKVITKNISYLYHLSRIETHDELFYIMFLLASPVCLFVTASFGVAFYSLRTAKLHSNFLEKNGKKNGN